MSASLRLVAVYALLSAALVAVLYLPGDPSPAQGQSGWIAVEALIVWRLARGSRFAWWAATVFASLGVAFYSVAMLGFPSIGLAAAAAISVAQLVVLARGPLNDRVWNRTAASA